MVGIDVLWTQGATETTQRRFTQVMTVRERLDLGYGGVDPVDLAFASLTPAVEEAHAPTHEGLREVLRSLP